MKKILTIITACLCAVNVAWAERVSEEDAALVASNFMNVATATPGALKAPAAKQMVKKSLPSTQAEQNRFYIYENANGEGWVMIAADDVVRPVLAYSETGSFNTDNMPANLQNWLRDYNKQINHAAARRTVATEAVQNEWLRLRAGARLTAVTPVVEPLIKTGWDQGSPYYNLCPKKGGSRTYTGCVATSMAQVMNYWQWPKQGIGSHSIKVGSTTYTVDFGATTYDWDNMLDTYNYSATAEQKTAVATLMYHCGVAVDMEYGTASEGGSGAYTIDWNGLYSGNGIMCTETALPEFFGYDASTIKGYSRDGWEERRVPSWSDSAWFAMLKDELDAGRPIMYDAVGCDDPDDQSSCYGHSFICDGYNSDDYFHFNWGWSNSCDGYYSLDALSPTEPGSGGGNGDYNYDHCVIVGIQPGTPPDTVVVTWMVNGEEFATTNCLGATYVLPGLEPQTCDSEVFVGWCTEADYRSPDSVPELVTSTTLLGADTCYALFATVTTGQQGEVSDVITRATTGATSSNYVAWSNKTLSSTAVYAGNTAGGHEAIQMRSANSNSGIVTTVSGGKARKITIDWSANTVNDRVVDVYGKNTAYVSASDLYDASDRGSLLGSIKKGTSTELTINGDYTFIGLRSRNSALYANSITILWDGFSIIYSDYTTEYECKEQGVENVSVKPAATKALRDGQLVIIRDNAVYSITGNRIQ